MDYFDIDKESKWCRDEPIQDVRQRLQYKKRKRGKPVYQYSLKGEFIKGWESAIDAATELGQEANHIYLAISGRKGRKKAFGYRWSYEKVENLNLS